MYGVTRSLIPVHSKPGGPGYGSGPAASGPSDGLDPIGPLITALGETLGRPARKSTAKRGGNGNLAQMGGW